MENEPQTNELDAMRQTANGGPLTAPGGMEAPPFPPMPGQQLPGAAGGTEGSLAGPATDTGRRLRGATTLA
jgi:hypothetical protein